MTPNHPFFGRFFFQLGMCDVIHMQLCMSPPSWRHITATTTLAHKYMYVGVENDIGLRKICRNNQHQAYRIECPLKGWTERSVMMETRSTSQGMNGRDNSFRTWAPKGSQYVIPTTKKTTKKRKMMIMMMRSVRQNFAEQYSPHLYLWLWHLAAHPSNIWCASAKAAGLKGRSSNNMM